MSTKEELAVIQAETGAVQETMREPGMNDNENALTAAGRGLEAVEKDIEKITEEILEAKRVGGRAVMTIGQKLVEAKSLLKHGEWLPWLTEQVEFSERTAQRFMRLYANYSKSDIVADLGSEKALALLALPEHERDGFAAGVHVVDGEEKTVPDMSVRELKQAIRERDEARRRLDDAHKEIKEARRELENAGRLKEEMERAREGERMARGICKGWADEAGRLKAELEALKNRPRDVAVQEVEAPADKDLAAFEVYFGEVQDTVNKLHGLLLKVRNRDQETAGKLAQALTALAGAIREAAA